MKITFLGTGDSFGSGGRHPTSILVRDDDVAVLLDCGPSVLPALRKSKVSAAEIDAVFITHYHGDHFGGVAFLLLEYRYRSPRRRPLLIAGPPGTRNNVMGLTRILFPGLEATPPGYRLDFRDLLEDRTENIGPADLTPFRVHHVSDGVAFGLSLRMSGRTVVFSGDTAWTDELARRTDSADLFICECSSLEPETALHMSYRDLIDRRGQIGAKRIVLTHAGEDVIARRSELAFELAADGQEIEL